MFLAGSCPPFPPLAAAAQARGPGFVPSNHLQIREAPLAGSRVCLHSRHGHDGRPASAEEDLQPKQPQSDPCLGTLVEVLKGTGKRTLVALQDPPSGAGAVYCLLLFPFISKTPQNFQDI